MTPVSHSPKWHVVVLPGLAVLIMLAGCPAMPSTVGQHTLDEIRQLTGDIHCGVNTLEKGQKTLIEKQNDLEVEIERRMQPAADRAGGVIHVNVQNRPTSVYTQLNGDELVAPTAVLTSPSPDTQAKIEESLKPLAGIQKALEALPCRVEAAINKARGEAKTDLAAVMKPVGEGLQTLGQKITELKPPLTKPTPDPNKEGSRGPVTHTTPADKAIGYAFMALFLLPGVLAIGVLSRWWDRSRAPELEGPEASKSWQHKHPFPAGFADCAVLLALGGCINFWTVWPDPSLFRIMLVWFILQLPVAIWSHCRAGSEEATVSVVPAPSGDRRDMLRLLLPGVSEEIRARRQPEYLYTAATIAGFGAVAWGVAALAGAKRPTEQSCVAAAVGVALVAVAVICKFLVEHRIYEELRRSFVKIFTALNGSIPFNSLIGEDLVPKGFREDKTGYGFLWSIVVVAIAAASAIWFCGSLL